MPDIFLSPSSQEFNPYINGGNEEYYMNIIADAMIPYLDASGISYGRNTPTGSFIDSVRASNSDDYKLHLAIHSNASPPQNAGKARGAQVYYYPNSENSKRAADIFANNFKEIYPIPSKVNTVPTTVLSEIAKTKAPAILIEVAYHDNEQDAQWIRDNINAIAENLVISVGDFLGKEIKIPSAAKKGRVNTNGTNLNLRAQPSVNSAIKGKIPDNTAVPLYDRINDWYLTEYKQVSGYVSGKYIIPLN
ncbi:MAG: N-acetylmuramoyl-L-alanine amidase [Clostridia bacterium]|nr:N-acetylmuramoyl-L-alanine amidase [Clostridia bacterium]